MRITDRTYSVLDIPLSPAEFVLFVALCVAGSIAFGAVLRLVCDLALRAWGGAS